MRTLLGELDRGVYTVYPLTHPPDVREPARPASKSQRERLVVHYP
jgi:hypothetical protein